jgi:hypothetical protein
MSWKEARAGDGNRTRMTSLEGWGSTIELRPRDLPGGSKSAGNSSPVAYRLEPAARTTVKAKPPLRWPCGRLPSLVTRVD